MPAKSKAQQHLMGMAEAVRKGKMKSDDVPFRVRKQVLALARDESVDVESFASTKTKGLPRHIGSNLNRGGRIRYP